MQPKDYIEAVIAIVFIGVGGLSMGWFKILKETNNLLKEQNQELKADNKEWQLKHSANEKAIANLQGQLNVLKDVPLQRIDSSLASISDTNLQILATLKSSAVTLVHDTKAAAHETTGVAQKLRASKG